MITDSGEPGNPSEPRLPRRAPRRNAPRHFTVPASEFTPSDQKPPTREEWDALQREIEERVERYERYERERLRWLEQQRREQDRREPA